MIELSVDDIYRSGFWNTVNKLHNTSGLDPVVAYRIHRIFNSCAGLAKKWEAHRTKLQQAFEEKFPFKPLPEGAPEGTVAERDIPEGEIEKFNKEIEIEAQKDEWKARVKSHKLDVSKLTGLKPVEYAHIEKLLDGEPEIA